MTNLLSPLPHISRLVCYLTNLNYLLEILARYLYFVMKLTFVLTNSFTFNLFSLHTV